MWCCDECKSGFLLYNTVVIYPKTLSKNEKHHTQTSWSTVYLPARCWKPVKNASRERAPITTAGPRHDARSSVETRPSLTRPGVPLSVKSLFTAGHAALNPLNPRQISPPEEKPPKSTRSLFTPHTALVFCARGPTLKNHHLFMTCFLPRAWIALQTPTIKPLL